MKKRCVHVFVLKMVYYLFNIFKETEINKIKVKVEVAVCTLLYKWSKIWWTLEIQQLFFTIFTPFILSWNSLTPIISIRFNYNPLYLYKKCIFCSDLKHCNTVCYFMLYEQIGIVKHLSRCKADSYRRTITLMKLEAYLIHGSYLSQGSYLIPGS